MSDPVTPPVEGADTGMLMAYSLAFSAAAESGLLATYSDPAEPDDIGSALTQDEIDFLKRLRVEILYRFNPPTEV